MSDKKILKETGEMSTDSLQPGGEYYEWGQMLKDAAQQLSNKTKGVVRFINVQPFDKYQGPYAKITINGKNENLWSLSERTYSLEAREWAGTIEELANAINGVEGASEIVTSNASLFSENTKKILKEGTWALPETRAQYKFAQSLIKELEVLTSKMYPVLGDDILFDGLANATSRANELLLQVSKENPSLLIESGKSKKQLIESAKKAILKEKENNSLLYKEVEEGDKLVTTHEIDFPDGEIMKEGTKGSVLHVHSPNVVTARFLTENNEPFTRTLQVTSFKLLKENKGVITYEHLDLQKVENVLEEMRFLYEVHPEYNTDGTVNLSFDSKVDGEKFKNEYDKL